MGLYYQTEYRLGRRGGLVCRNYTGCRAFLAIAIDLFFVLTFDLLLGLVFFILRNMLKLLAVVFYLLTIPFRLTRRIVRALVPRYPADGHGHPQMPLKPAWTGFDEL